MFTHLWDIFVEFCHQAHLSVKVEMGSGDLGLAQLMSWVEIGWEANLLLFTLLCCHPSVASLEDQVQVPHQAPQHKKKQKPTSTRSTTPNEVSWVCVSLEVETYGNWGKEANDTFSYQLAIGSAQSKSRLVFEIFSRINLTPYLNKIYSKSNFVKKTLVTFKLIL